MNADLVYANGGKCTKLGEAYNRANYVENDRNTYLATANSGYNRSLVGKGMEGVMQAGMGTTPNEHWIGPGLILAGQPIKALKPIGALGSSPGSSIASKTLSKVFPYRSPVIKEITSLFGRASSTAVLGRALGRFVPVAGWGLTIYDAWDNRETIGEFIRTNRETNEAHRDDLSWHVR